MKAEVYSWRLSEELKSDLEREARLRKLPVSSVLDLAVRDWLKKSGANVAGDETQRALHAAAENCLGTVASGNSRRAETTRKTIRRRLQRRREPRGR
ncbi:MAG: hypothetical protein ABSC10_04110 [Candidatus Acidiferrales bacterium]|jgi:hypothetical protein